MYLLRTRTHAQLWPVDSYYWATCDVAGLADLGPGSDSLSDNSRFNRPSLPDTLQQLLPNS